MHDGKIGRLNGDSTYYCFFRERATRLQSWNSFRRTSPLHQSSVDQAPGKPNAMEPQLYSIINRDVLCLLRC